MAAARRFAERIQHESTRLGRLVNELLELSRLQGADPLPDPEPVSVDWVVAEVIDRTRTAAAAREIEVVVEGRRGLTVYGSDSQFATALANLVENAIAYSNEETRVTITTALDESSVVLSVADQGIGIAPDDLDRIFERFYRADRPAPGPPAAPASAWRSSSTSPPTMAAGSTLSAPGGGFDVHPSASGPPAGRRPPATALY